LRLNSFLTRACLASLLFSSVGFSQTYKTWSDYGGSADSAQYSALKQIDRSNVAQLQVAWTYGTGDGKKYAFNPLEAGGLLYVLAKNNSIVALDAATGKQVWIHENGPDVRVITNRGLNYWVSKDGSDRRLLFASNNFLRELDARTGKLIRSFGKEGLVDLREGLGRDPNSMTLVQSTTPGRIFEDLLILGSATNEGYGSAPGDVRAFDVRTGRQVWSFHTIPHPGEYGYDTWPKDAWKTAGGANAWSELSLDAKRGIVYIPTASPKYNFYGANRKGANLFGDSLLALDARTGKRFWHFQMVHHDIWDYDNATAPKLLTVDHDGKPTDIVAQPGKAGFLWVFNRVTGKPLWPIEERAVPKSDMPGEETWPTQPFPTKPPAFSRQKFTAGDLSPFIANPEEKARLRDQILSARNEGLFTPPSTRGTIQMPGNNGGANWGGAAIDPTDGTVYVVSKDLPALLKMEPENARKTSVSDSPEQQGKVVYQINCERCHGAGRLGQPPAVPSLADIGKRLSPAEISGVVAQGHGSMPGFAKLPGNAVGLLVAYLNNPARGDAPASIQTAPMVQRDPKSVRYFSGFGFMITSEGTPAIKPPWTSLTAYDLNHGTIKWQVPLGTVPELAARGFKDTGSHYPKVGPVATAGGLIFAGTRDRKVRALDKDTGKVLWEAEVPAALEGIPAVYEVNGRQYVVFCAAAQADARGAAKNIPGSYIAFALPESHGKGKR
jgi:quinoprotein glucose dehydrogenase